MVAILEDHTKPDPAEVVNTLAVIDTESQTVSSLVSGSDFYTSATFSPDGTHLAWSQWSHPDMPWDGSEVYVASVSLKEGGTGLVVANSTYVAGKALTIGAGDPIWISNDRLLHTSDETGYQNPYIYDVNTRKSSLALSKPLAEDFSHPAWRLGNRYGAVLDKEGSKVLLTSLRDGRSRLYILSLHSNELEELSCPYVSIEHIFQATDDHVVFVGAKSDEPASIVLASLKDYALPHYSTLKFLSPKTDFPSGLISKPQPMTLLVPPNNDPVHIVYYPPTNPEYEYPGDEKPPCIVHVHGGPTALQDQGYSASTQFFTSRGWALLVSSSSVRLRRILTRLLGSL